MRTYIVHEREVWIQAYQVEANNPEHAKRLVKNRDAAAEMMEDMLEYSHTLDESHTTVEEIT